MYKDKKFEVYLSDTTVLTREDKYKIHGEYFDTKSKKTVIKTTGFMLQKEFKAKKSANIVTIDEIMDAGDLGKVVKPMSFHKLHSVSGDNIKFIEVWYIDVDNGSTIDEIIDICTRAKLPFNGIKRSISHTDELHKFHVICGLAKPLTKEEFAKKSEYLIKILFNNKIDPCSFKSDQMYYGSPFTTTNRQFDEFIHLEDPDFYIDNYLKSIDPKSFKRNKDNLLKKYGYSNSVSSAEESRSLYNIYSSTPPRTPTTIPGLQNTPDNVTIFDTIDENLTVEGDLSKFIKSHEIKHYLNKIDENISPTIFKFLNGHKMELQELFGIISNLRFFRGGEKLFFKIFEENKFKYNSYDHKVYKIKQLLEDISFPFPFSKFCNDHTIVINRSEHPVNKINLLTQLQIKGISNKMKLFKLSDNKKIYSSIDEIREVQAKDINDVIEKDDKKIHIFYSETGIGKTTTLLLSKIWNKRFFFAALSHEKIAEIQYDLKNNSMFSHIDTKNTKFAVKIPDIPDIYSAKKDEIVKNWNMKLPGNFKIFEEFAEKLDDEFGMQCKELIKFKRHNFSAFNTFSTHHDLLNNLKKVNTTKDIIVIDEDITSLLGEMNETNLRDLDGLITFVKKIRKGSDNKIKKEFDVIVERLERIMGIPEKSIKSVSNDVNEKLYTNLISAYKNNSESTLMNLIKDKYFYKNLEGKILSIGEMKKEIKLTTIILSATASPEIYKMIFGDNNVIIHNYDEVKKFNTTYQYGQHTMSKQSLNRLHSVGKLKEILEPAKDVDLVITFKSGLNFDIKQYFSENTEVRYFGPSSVGINEYAGKNICILGTPRPTSDQLRMLYAGIMNDDELSEEDLEIVYKDVIKGQFKGVGIKFFNNEILSMIQDNLIYSQLQQARGRNRGLINTGKEFFTHIFSNFPIDDPSIILK